MIKVVCDFCGKTVDKQNIKKINQNNLDICNECIEKLKVINQNENNEYIFEVVLADVCNVAEGFQKRKSVIVQPPKNIYSVVEELKKETPETGDWRTIIIINKYVKMQQSVKEI